MKLRTILMFCICLLTLNQAAFAQDSTDLNAALNQLFQAYINNEMTSDVWQQKMTQTIDEAQKKGQLTAEQRDQMVAALPAQAERFAVIADYNRQSATEYKACTEGTLSSRDYVEHQTGSLKSMLTNGIIDQNTYDATISDLNAEALKCRDAQNGAASQFVTQMNELQSSCQSSRIAVDEMVSKKMEIATTYYNSGQMNAEDYAAIQSQIQNDAAKCRAFQAFGQTIEANRTQYVNKKMTGDQLYQATSDEADRLVSAGYASEADKSQLLQELRAEIDKAEKRKEYESTLLGYKYSFESGSLSLDEYKSSASNTLFEMLQKSLISSAEYQSAVEQVNATLDPSDYYYDNQRYSYSDGSGTFHYETSGTGDNTVIYHDGSRNGWDIRLGLTAGVILDTLRKSDTRMEDKYETATFWANRDEDEKLMQYGVTVAFGYQWTFGGLYLQQELGGGNWLGNASELPGEFLGATYFVGRLQYPFDGTNFRISLDLGVGMAYGGGDSRSDRGNSDYHPAYIFGDALDPYIAAAFKFGISFDFFITDELYLGFKFDCNILMQMDVNVSYSETYSAGLSHFIDSYTATLSHDMIYLQPGIQVGYVF